MTAGRVATVSVVLLVASGWLAPTAHASANRINNVRLSTQGDSAVVEITGGRAPNFTTFKQDSPRRVIVDVAECHLGQVPARIQGDGQLVTCVTTAQYGVAPHGISRVIIALQQAAEYKVTTRGGSLFVHLTPGAGGLLVSAGVPVAPERASRPGAAGAQSEQGLDLPLEVHPAPEADAEHLPVQVAAATPAVQPRAAAPAPAAAEPAPAAEPESEPVEPPQPEPVRVAMASSAPLPAAPAQERSMAPTLVAQGEVEEVEEPPEEVDVPEAPEADVPTAPVEDSGTEDVPPPPDAAPYEEVPPPPPPPPAATEQPAAEDSAVEEIPSPPEDSGAVEVPSAPEEVPPAPEEIPPPPDNETGDAIEEVPTSPGYSEVEERVEISGALKDMTWVGFQQTMEASRVFIKTNAPVRYHVSEEGDNLVVLELENTRIPLRNNSRFLDTHFFATAVTMITPREIEGVSSNVRIEIQLRNKVPYSAGQDDNMVYLDFQRP